MFSYQKQAIEMIGDSLDSGIYIFNRSVKRRLWPSQQRHASQRFIFFTLKRAWMRVRLQIIHWSESIRCRFCYSVHCSVCICWYCRHLGSANILTCRRVILYVYIVGIGGHEWYRYFRDRGDRYGWVGLIRCLFWFVYHPISLDLHWINNWMQWNKLKCYEINRMNAMNEMNWTQERKKTCVNNHRVKERRKVQRGPKMEHIYIILV